MDHYASLSLSAQTAYAQLLDAAQALELARSVASLRGSFANKTVKGGVYRYFQYILSCPAGCASSMGPDSPQVRVDRRSMATVDRLLHWNRCRAPPSHWAAVPVLVLNISG